MGVLKDLMSGNFSGVIDDIKAAFAKLPQVEQDFISKVESDAWAEVRALADTFINDVVAGGFSTASFVKAAKDIVTTGATQGKQIGISEAVIQLNILADAIRPPATDVTVPPADEPKEDATT